MDPSPSPLGDVPARRWLPAASLVVAATWVAAAAASASSASPTSPPGRQAQETDHYEFVESWPLPPPPFHPLDAAYGPDGTVFICDAGNQSVRVFGPDGALSDEWRHERSAKPGSDAMAFPVAVDVDPARQSVYVLWVTAPKPRVHEPLANELQKRHFDGSIQATARGLSGGDIAIDPSTGDVHILGSSARVRLKADTLAPGNVWGWPHDHHPSRVAAFPSGRLAVSLAEDRALLFFKANAIDLDPLRVSTGSVAPVAIDVDERGILFVLLAADDTPGPDDPALALFDEWGRELGVINQRDLGIPLPPNAYWPWAIDLAQPGLVVSTGALTSQVVALGTAHEKRLTLLGGPLLPAQQIANHRPLWGLPVQRLALGPLIDQELPVLAPQLGRVLYYNLAGDIVSESAAPGDATDVAIDREGQAFLSIDDGSVIGVEQDGTYSDWLDERETGLGSRVATGADYLFISRPLLGRVDSIDIRDQRAGDPFELEGAFGLWPTDVAASLSGRLYTADALSLQVQAWSSTGGLEAAWPVGLLAGPRRLAVTSSSDSGEIVAVLLADGYVEVHSATGGDLLARWKPTLPNRSEPRFSDIAIGADGRIYFADSAAGAVQVFERAQGPTPTPASEPPIIPTPREDACQIEGDKWAGPARIALGDTARVTLTLAAHCPKRAEHIGADIVLVQDVSVSMRGQKIEAAKEAIFGFVSLLDVRYHRVGLVSFGRAVDLTHRLTSDVSSVVRAAHMLEVGGNTPIRDGVFTAMMHLRTESRADALPVIILLTDGRFADGQDPRGVALDARNSGIQIFAVGLGQDADQDVLHDVAGQADRYYYAPTPEELFPIYQEVLRVVMLSLAGNLVIYDEMADHIRYVSGSARPSAIEQPELLVWSQKYLPSSGITMTYRIQPQRTGHMPTNRSAVAKYTDTDGVRRQYVFPIPYIEVVAPAPSPTPRPTATSRPPTIYLPLILREECIPGQVNADVALVIDASTSMRDLTREGRPKLVAAVDAVSLFLHQLDMPRDRAAIVQFNSTAQLLHPLSGHRSGLVAALGRVTVAQQTRIDLGLKTAREALSTSSRNPASQPVIILLTDGKANPVGPMTAVDEALRAKREGIAVFAIGLGPELDVSALEAMVSKQDYFHRAPDAEDLKAIYSEIAVEIPCPMDDYWGRR